MKIWLPNVRAGSGSDVYVERLADMLSRAGHRPVVSWFPHWYEFAPWLLRTAQPPEGTDIIHATSWNAFALAGKGCPVITTVHHSVGDEGYPRWKSWPQRLYHQHRISRLERKSFGVSSAVMAVSHSTAADLVRLFDVHARVIDNWIDTDIFRPGERAGHPMPRVLFVGNLSKRKGGDLLPALRQQLAERVELNIVGGRRAQTSALAGIGSNTKVWTGLSDQELIRLYQQCDVTVCLSRHEGFGYAALEAMACGRPVVAFDVAGIRDVVDPDVSGKLLPCEDVGGVAAACHALLQDPAMARSMGDAGRRRAVELFSVARATAGYEALYREVLARG